MKKNILIAGAVFCASLVFTSCLSLGFLSSDSLIEMALNTTGEMLTNEELNAAKKGVKEVSKLNPSQEYYLGRTIAATLLSNYEIYDNPEVTQYLNDICGALLLNDDDKVPYNGYSVAILDTDELNAFSTCGGHILVTKGMLETVKTEDQLASVIAHEIGHIQLKHSIEGIKSSRKKDLNSQIFKIVAGNITSTVVEEFLESNDFLSEEIASAFGTSAKETVMVFSDSVTAGVGVLTERGYSKTQEFEADEYAVLLLENAGYNPKEIKEMLTAIRVKAKANRKLFANLSKTHPSPNLRKMNLKSDLRKFKKCKTDPVRVERFAKVMENL